MCFANEDNKKENKEPKKEDWKKKNIRDYSDADLERLLDQWEDNDEDKLEEDELPEWKREPPKVDLSKLDPKNPEEMLQMSKKGRSLMMFATVAGEPSEKEMEKITSLWHSSLYNAHIDTQRYVVGSNRVIFMLTDGSKAWEVKDFLVQQDNCEEVTIEGKNYPGKGANQKKDEDTTEKKQSENTKNKVKDKSTLNKQSDDETISNSINKKTKNKKSDDIIDNTTERKKEEL